MVGTIAALYCWQACVLVVALAFFFCGTAQVGPGHTDSENSRSQEVVLLLAR